MEEFYNDLTLKIQQAVKKVMSKILQKTGDETIYAAALVTDSDCTTLFLAVNTYEYLEKRDLEYLQLMDFHLSEEEQRQLNEGTASLTKWLPDEWGYADSDDDDGSELFNEISRLLYEHDEEEDFDDDAYEENQELFFAAVTSAFQKLKEEKAFGERTEEILCFISISDDDRAEEIENESARQLNSPQLYEPFFNRCIL
ncbi:MAG: DUF4303 domain-containing protein [Lachnospiraceae bacterium]|nr:DUF4303 domain-containing protein [Lachnospiraceae bacterium]